MYLLPHTLIHKTIYLLSICTCMHACVIGLVLAYYHMYKQLATNEFILSKQKPMRLLGTISYTRKADTGTKQRPFFLSSLLSYAPSSLIVVSVVVFAPFTSPVVVFCKFRRMYIKVRFSSSKKKVRFSFFKSVLLCVLNLVKLLYQSKWWISCNKKSNDDFLTAHLWIL